MSQERLIDAIEHYQRNLDRGIKDENPGKLLYCISKLSNMPITVAHLEATGIGRTVNAMRKIDGDVGNAARELVNKWKLMVSQNQDCNDAEHNDSCNRSDSSQRPGDRTKSESSSSEGEDVGSTEDEDDNDSDEDEETERERNSRKSNSSDRNNKDKHRSKSNGEKHKRRSPEKDAKHRKHSEPSKSKRKRDPSPEETPKKSKKSEREHEKPHKRDKDRDRRSEKKVKEKSEESRDSKSHHKEKHKKEKSSSSGGGGSGSGTSKTTQNEFGICSESGTSFAEALGMLEPSTSKGAVAKKPKPEKKEKERERDREPGSSSSKSESKERHHHRKEKERSKETSRERDGESSRMEVRIPPPPPKLDVDINISSLLPTITPNYRPLANPLYDSPNPRSKPLNEDEALSYVMSQKNQRTKVFSGNKTFWGSIPTLFELCMRVLQDNIDGLEYTGGVPYSILKPLLEKATAQQLYTMEHFNPYLIDDTDDIWRFHCSKDFKNRKRDEMESWREMYTRCLDEREAKLKAVTEIIKVAQEKSTPVRQTKLAYIDNYVKPPRDIIRKQAKNGLDKRPLVTPQQRLNAIAAGSSNSQVSVPNPGRAASSSSSSAVKPKKAPLMQKTLAFLKGGRFRR